MSKDFTFKISRIFEAPLSLMWKAWTDKTMASKWFGPKGCTIIYDQFNLKAGGEAHYYMNFNGTKSYGKWHYLEIIPEKKLVSLVSFTDDKYNIIAHPMEPNWPKEINSTIIFTAKGDKTEMLVEWKAHNANELQAKTFKNGMSGMNQGWNGTLDQLAEFLKTQ